MIVTMVGNRPPPPPASPAAAPAAAAEAATQASPRPPAAPITPPGPAPPPSPPAPRQADHTAAAAFAAAPAATAAPAPPVASPAPPYLPLPRRHRRRRSSPPPPCPHYSSGYRLAPRHHQLLPSEGRHRSRFGPMGQEEADAVLARLACAVKKPARTRCVRADRQPIRRTDTTQNCPRAPERTVFVLLRTHGPVPMRFVLFCPCLAIRVLQSPTHVLSLLHRACTGRVPAPS